MEAAGVVVKQGGLVGRVQAAVRLPAGRAPGQGRAPWRCGFWVHQTVAPGLIPAHWLLRQNPPLRPPCKVSLRRKPIRPHLSLRPTVSDSRSYSNTKPAGAKRCIALKGWPGGHCLNSQSACQALPNYLEGRAIPTGRLRQAILGHRESAQGVSQGQPGLACRLLPNLCQNLCLKRSEGSECDQSGFAGYG